MVNNEESMPNFTQENSETFSNKTNFLVSMIASKHTAVCISKQGYESFHIVASFWCPATIFKFIFKKSELWCHKSQNNNKVLEILNQEPFSSEGHREYRYCLTSALFQQNVTNAKHDRCVALWWDHSFTNCWERN